MLDFGRDTCGRLPAAEQREWLVANGIGGYASGSVAGLLTRRYHGLLIAALKPPVGRTLLLTKLDESVAYNGSTYPLYTNRWANGRVEPNGFYHLERFHLEGTTPVWRYACADARVEKRVWMQPGANTTFIRYDLCAASLSLFLSIKAFVNYRDHHGNSLAGDWKMQIEPVRNGLHIRAFSSAQPFYVLSERAEVTPLHEWVTEYFLSVEDYRGLDALDDHLCAGLFQVRLRAGESLTIVASTDAHPNLDGNVAYAERQRYEHKLTMAASLDADFKDKTPSAETEDETGLAQRLALAADQFIVRRSLPGAPDGHTILAGYPWFSDWGRDTMISLPGLALTTGRYDIAASILRTFAQVVDLGMLPNRFPDAGEQPEYNTVDATLWYFEAIRAYADIMRQQEPSDDGRQPRRDEALLPELMPVLEQIVDWHLRGTRYGIRVDPLDGLLRAGEPGVQLTWMDAKVGDWVVTPRVGKAVEINALWYNALRCMADFARRLGQPAERYTAMAEQAQAGFGRFWNEASGCCYDVIDGPNGDDPSLRPNQLLAVSLPYSPLSSEQRRTVVDVCARKLLTSHGLRSLSPDDPAYVGHYGGDQRQRDGAYHQGTVWSWLIGPFIAAHLRVYGNSQQAFDYLRPLLHHLNDHGLGSVSEIFDGDPPFTPRGCIAQAWGVAEVLRAWQLICDFRVPATSDVTLQK